MAKPDRTPWEPGIIVLSVEDFNSRNPYNGYFLTQEALILMYGALTIICYQMDSAISLIQRQSKH